MTCRDDWANLPPQHPSVAGSHYPHSEAPLAQAVGSQVAKKESQRAGLSDRKSPDDALAPCPCWVPLRHLTPWRKPGGLNSRFNSYSRTWSLNLFFLCFYSLYSWVLFITFLSSHEIIKHLDPEMSKTQLLPSLSWDCRYKHIELIVGCIDQKKKKF